MHPAGFSYLTQVASYKLLQGAMLLKINERLSQSPTSNFFMALAKSFIFNRGFLGFDN
jgi:hypothetical protein